MNLEIFLKFTEWNMDVTENDFLLVDLSDPANRQSFRRTEKEEEETEEEEEEEKTEEEEETGVEND